jgi:uncharacterized protein (TIGR03067 family)
MSRLILAALALITMARPSAARPFEQGELSKEFQSLQGTWVVRSENGKAVAAGDPEVTLVIEGTKYSQTIDGKVVERGEIRLDPSKTPMVMDLFITEGADANKAQFGVVRIEGVGMTLKLNAPAEPTRPKDFAVAEGYTVIVATKKITDRDD